MNKGVLLSICALASAPMLYLMWVSSQKPRVRSEQQLDEMLDDSFPASDPPAHGNFTAAG